MWQKDIKYLRASWLDIKKLVEVIPLFVHCTSTLSPRFTWFKGRIYRTFCPCIFGCSYIHNKIIQLVLWDNTFVVLCFCHVPHFSLELLQEQGDQKKLRDLKLRRTVFTEGDEQCTDKSRYLRLICRFQVNRMPAKLESWSEWVMVRPFPIESNLHCAGFSAR